MLTRLRLRVRSANGHPLRAAFAAGVLSLGAIACGERPTAPEVAFDPGIPALAKLPSCPAQINLTVTAAGLSGSLDDDGANYTEGVGGVLAHTSGVNGNLMFNVQSSSPPRTVTVTTSLGSAPQSTRIFTNNHEQACGLAGMPSVSSGTAVLEVEWADASNRYTLRYGKDCVGTFGQVVPANKIATSRSGNAWTLTGDAGEGILCRGSRKGQPNWTQVGTADAFTMILTGP